MTSLDVMSMRDVMRDVCVDVMSLDVTFIKVDHAFDYVHFWSSLEI